MNKDSDHQEKCKVMHHRAAIDRHLHLPNPSVDVQTKKVPSIHHGSKLVDQIKPSLNTNLRHDLQVPHLHRASQGKSVNPKSSMMQKGSSQQSKIVLYAEINKFKNSNPRPKHRITRIRRSKEISLIANPRSTDIISSLNCYTK